MDLLTVGGPVLRNLFVCLLDDLQQLFLTVGQFVVMVWDVLVLIFTRFLRKDLVLRQLFDIGARSVPLVCITGLATGMVLAAQSFFQLSDKGLAGTTGIMVAKSMLVEIGPLLTSFMITGRVGASMCAELGSMRVTEQVDAMSSMGVHPLEYLVVPRFVAMACMMPILTIFSSACGIFGGWFLSTSLYGMSSQTFFDPLPIYITWFDVTSNIVKSWTFGLIIVSIACFRGLNTTGGAAGVGRSTTSSVVVSYTCILGANFLLTVFFNAAYWYIFGFQ
jgi:phospholipid/cholesterol/gamma-HCH transport system permease protein